MSSDIWFLTSLLRKALSAATPARRVGACTWEWDISGRCESPNTRELFARPPEKRTSNWAPGFVGMDEPAGPGTPLRLYMIVPCRKCAYCLRKRSAQWRDRARLETDISQRTWFCTWTLHPDRLTYYKSKARAALSAQSSDLEQVAHAEQFQRLVWAIGRAFTLGFKRLRKNTGASFRYVVVAECHKSGAPHFHGLIHEDHGSPPITHAALMRDLWNYMPQVNKRLRKELRRKRERLPEGFVKYKLADEKAAGYVTKYLSKSMLARVRASVRYGKPALAVSPRRKRVSDKFDYLLSKTEPPF